MPARLIYAPYRADVGDTLRVLLVVSDLYGVAAAADSVAAVVTLPDATVAAGTVAVESLGLYMITYDVTAAGTHTVAVTVASAVFGDDVVTWTVQASAAAPTARVTLEDVVAYLGDDNSYSQAEVQGALEAEQAAQARRCAIPVDYPADLGEAIKRRVARNLAARSVPVASWTSFEGGGTASRVTKYDAEVVRLESPYLRLISG